MSYQDVMNTILPKQGNHSAHITGHYGEHRANGPHGGSDFNYQGGQQGANLEHPTVHTPVAGVVTFAGGQYGTIKIRDADGNSHEILHTQSQSVVIGQRLEAGDAIGTMGGRGPNGATQYAQHVHYQMKDAQGHPVNPETYWAQHTHDAPAHSTPSIAHPHLSHASSDGILHRGDQGQAVRNMQRELAQLGYRGLDGEHLKDDGKFGPSTVLAVETFQHDQGLKVDGIAGPETLKALEQVQGRAQPSKAPQLNDAAHPDHAMYRQALAGVHALDIQHGRTPDVRSEQLAAALTVSARQAGLHRIDSVALDADAKHVFAAQGPLDSPLKRVASVPTMAALETPVSHSSQQWEQVTQQTSIEHGQRRQQAQQQPHIHAM